MPGRLAFVLSTLYWRLGSDVELPENTPEGLQQAFGYMQRLDQAGAIQDASSALSFARDLPETSGRAGVLGFCMGGRLAYQVAAGADPDVLVSYYGSGIARQLDTAPRITAPTIFTSAKPTRTCPPPKPSRSAPPSPATHRREVHMHHGAGHAFDNPSPMFNHAGSGRGLAADVRVPRAPPSR